MTSRRKKQRSTTLDPSSDAIQESARRALDKDDTINTNGHYLRTKNGGKSKSKPSSSTPTPSSSSSSSKKKKKKLRSNSNVDDMKFPSMASLTVDMQNVNTRAANKKSKAARKHAQTPAGTSSIRSMPAVSISTSITSPSLASTAVDIEDDLTLFPMAINGKRRGGGNAARSNSARASQKHKPETFGALFEAENSNNSNGNQPMLMTLANSSSIQKAAIALDDRKKQIAGAIAAGFTGFHSALNERQSKLTSELESAYADKKTDITAIERKLFSERGKTPKKKASKKPNHNFAFDANLSFVLNKPKCVRQISKFGRFQDDDAVLGDSDFDDDAADIFKRKMKFKARDSRATASLTQLHVDDDDAKMAALKDGDENGGDDGRGSSGDDDDDDADAGVELSTAQKQKLVLGDIQLKTMSKLDMVILMEKEARRKKKQAAKLEIEVKEALKYIAERTKFINEKLESARPELEKSRQAVAGIDPKDINEIKTLKSPPKVVENVMTATVMLLGHPIKVWTDVKKLLSYKFKPELLGFDTYTLTKETRQKVYKKYASKEDFNYDRVDAASKVCGNLVLWCLSQINYSRILDVIIPLEKEVKKLQKDAKKKEKLAKELLKLVQALQVNIEEYTKECNEMVEHIIKSTDSELKQFSDKLAPLNEKFNSILNNKNLDK